MEAATTWVPIAINVLLGLVAFWGGLWVRNLQEALRGTRTEVATLREKVSDSCVRRDDYLLMRAEMLDRLVGIEAKLDKLIAGQGGKP